jgi:hypothetical protein
MPVEYVTPAIEDRAVEVQALLANLGKHRDPAVPDLLVAATVATFVCPPPARIDA